MSNLVNYAINELELAGFLDKDKDFYGGLTGKTVLELIEVFSRQGHSGMSAGIVVRLFSKLARFKPITPLTFDYDEWQICSLSNNSYQNLRNSSVFKEGVNGKPYHINAFNHKNQNGIIYSGELKTSKGTISHCYIKDAKNMPTITIDVIDCEVKEGDASVKQPGSGWWVNKLVDESQLEELEKYYDVEYTQ